MRFLILLITTVALLLTSQEVKGQEFEIGVFGGVSAYSGDLSPEEFGFFIEDSNPAGGLYLRFRPTSRIAFRVQGMISKLSATADEPFQTINGIGRPLNFRTTYSEIGLQGEIDLFYIGDKNANHLAPYLTIGVSFASYNPEGNRDGVWTELQPLRTEGQGIGGDNYAAVPYSLTEVTPILGGGLRWRISDRIVIGGEISGRRFSSDYLDDVSNTRVNYLDILENTGPLGASFSNPNIDDPATAERLDYRRGGEFADWAFFGGITLGITLGEGSGGRRGQTGCYQF